MRSELEGFRDELSQEGDTPVHMLALDYSDASVGFLERMQADLKRLVAELPQGVKNAHVALLEQMILDLDIELRRCQSFKKEYQGSPGLEPHSRWLMDRLYADYAGLVWDFADFGSMASRLRTFVDLPVADDNLKKSLADSIEAKPNFFGFGVDLKKALTAILARIRRGRSTINHG